MAKKTKIIEEVDVEELDLDFGDLELAEEADDEMEEEIVEAPKAKKAKAATTEKAKRTAPSGSTLSSIQPLADGQVGAAYIAEMCGVAAKDIRSFLRANYRDMNENKGTRYSFDPKDPIVQEIADAFKVYQARPKKAFGGKKAETIEDDDEVEEIKIVVPAKKIQQAAKVTQLAQPAKKKGI